MGQPVVYQKLLDEIDALLVDFGILKADKYDKIASKMQKMLFAEWNKGQKEAINIAIARIKAGNGSLTSGEVDKIVTEMEDYLGMPMAEGLRKSIKSIVIEAYSAGKEQTLGISPHFNETDLDAIKWISDDTVYWVGNYFSKELSHEIAGAAKEAIKAGLTREEAGSLFKETLFVAAKKGNYYWEGLANHVTTRSREFGNIEGYVEAGARRYRIVAVIDNRTSKICKEMHGRIINVNKGVKLRNALMAAKKPEDVKTIAPWMSPGKIKGKATKNLKLGMSLPPYHFNCRTRTVMASHGEKEIGSHTDQMIADDTLIETPEKPTSQPKQPAKKPKPRQRPPRKPAGIVPGVQSPDKKPPKTPMQDYKPDSGWPPDLESLEFVRNLGGSTGAKLMKDLATGKLYVLKQGNSPEHIQNEMLANAIYKAAGVQVPEFRSYENGKVMVSEFVEGVPIGKNPKAAILKKVKAGFAVDALLGNHDVVGLNGDNILVDKKGRVWRVDNGGSLKFRAQGEIKEGFGRAFNENVNELWTMRESSQGAPVFGDLDYGEIVKQVRSVYRKRKAIFKQINDPEIKQIIERRLGTYKEVADLYKTFKDDRFKDIYIDKFAKHLIGIREFGISDTLPKKLKARSSRYILFDENRKRFDDLKNTDSGATAMFEAYLHEIGQGSTIATLRRYQEHQGGSSSKTYSLLAQYKVWKYREGFRARDVSWDYKRGNKLSYKETAQLDNPSEDDGFIAFHALTYETLLKIKFANKDDKARRLKIIRTVSDSRMKREGIFLKYGHYTVYPGGKPRMLESSSVFEPTYVSGHERMVFNVPFHRVYGTYLTRRIGDRHEEAPYLSLHENEFHVMLDGLEYDYVAKYIPKK